MEDLRDLKDFADTRCEAYKRRINYRTEALTCSTFEPSSGMKIVSSDTPFARNPASTSAKTAEERPAFSHRGGIVFEAHRRLYHSAYGSRTF